ncbi:hypothetical protein D3C78_1777920 [compost metagenome]
MDGHLSACALALWHCLPKLGSYPRLVLGEVRTVEVLAPTLHDVAHVPDLVTAHHCVVFLKVSDLACFGKTLAVG